MKQQIVLLISLISFVSGATRPFTDAELNEQFEQFKRDYSRTYNSESEETQRKSIFASNLELILHHNALAQKGLKSFELGVNNLADLPNEEYRSLYIGFSAGHAHLKFLTSRALGRKVHAVPDSFDWTDKGVVTPARDQGKACRSGWAFGAVAALEGLNAIRYEKYLNLSEQNLVDCAVGSYNNVGCEGGLVANGFWYVKDNGLDLASVYPYAGKDQPCSFQSKSIGIKIFQWEGLSQSEDELKNTLPGIGPMAGSIDASSPSFQLYKSGVYDEPNCSSTFVNHGIAIVGYGVEGEKNFWKVKNSFGAGWGENGFIRMSRNKANQCGIASQVNYPI